MNFETWMKKLNAFLVAHIGLEAEDLPDEMYWDAWNEGEDPKEFAMQVLLENSGYNFDD